METLYKLTLKKFERRQTHRGLMLASRAKALTMLAQQCDVLTTALQRIKCLDAGNVTRDYRADRKLYQRNWWRYRNYGRR